MLQNFKLKNKINLTHNVYEMDFESENEINMKPGQFITFLIDSIWWRAYSILSIEKKVLKLIIKKRELEEGWRWWSKYLCELNIWDSLRWVWPAGHFTLKENKNNKLFIWTGTWFVPLYNMIKYSLKNNKEVKLNFTFWVREKDDLFYLDELEKLKKQNHNFDYEIYISRVKDLHDFKKEHLWNKINSWYTTNFLTDENLNIYEEVYICWAPMMIESSVLKLKDLWFKDEQIFFEKY